MNLLFLSALALVIAGVSYRLCKAWRVALMPKREEPAYVSHEWLHAHEQATMRNQFQGVAWNWPITKQNVTEDARRRSALAADRQEL